MLLEPVQPRPGCRGNQLPVHAQVLEPLARGPGREVRVVTLARRDQRGEHRDSFAPVLAEKPRGDRVRRLGLDGDPAIGTMLGAELHE